MRRLWRCRACGTVNDFEGQENALNEQLRDEHKPEVDENGVTTFSFATLGEYRCAGCAFSVEPEPMWFVTDVGEEPMFHRVRLRAGAHPKGGSMSTRTDTAPAVLFRGECGHSWVGTHEDDHACSVCGDYACPACGDDYNACPVSYDHLAEAEDLPGVVVPVWRPPLKENT